MNELKLIGNESKPDVCLDKKRGVFVIGGRSLPEDAVSTYKPIMDWINEYISSPNSSTVFDIGLEYINSPSMKQIARLLFALQKIADNGNDVKVLWHYSANDTDTKDHGVRLAKLVTYPFILVADAAK